MLHYKVAPAFLSEFADDVGYLRTADLDTQH